MTKQAIQTTNAPAAIGPYSQAIRVGDMLFCSGQIPLNPTSGELLTGPIEDQTHLVMKNIQGVLTAAGASFDNVVKTTIFLQSLNDFAKVNEIYGSYFKQPFPARSTVEVAKLPRGAGVEIEVIAKL